MLTEQLSVRTGRRLSDKFNRTPKFLHQITPKVVNSRQEMDCILVQHSG